ncbi:SusD/RagB family nutrient-binding outer membrane lipoprotein [Algoriphagus vanfongensis]|uniref:SusD/RagB family nutrient-binding outer membrane lipoprotein n=1 Tax=Algoriphagus vanfongensis TaxID=426371 RepID=UPI000479F796|nr:SusD/RagB family nutrient-binding outer membrane lipoprotein [Algoriphagus vanfongensis]
MKFKSLYIGAIVAASLVSCTESDFADNYTDPAKVAETTVGKQFTGMIYSFRNYVLPTYDDYFIGQRITNNRYTQAIGWVNVENQYVPGSEAINRRWRAFYETLAQYREIEKIFEGLSEVAAADQRIYMIAAKTFLYDQAQKEIDYHGDIPFTQAAMLSQNGGDYQSSYAPYDDAETLYTMMLDELAAMADEMNTMTVNPGVLAEFEIQDVINDGDLTLWKKYINSVRLRMLTRVSGTSTFSARATAEIGDILSNPATYPVVTSIEDFIAWDGYTAGTWMQANSFQTGLEDWDGNIAGKVILDHMLDNEDPRLTFVFEPGLEAEPGQYMGLDPLLNASAQNELVLAGTLSIYNRSTLSRNQNFPGIIISASEVNFLAAEYYLKTGQNAMAQAAYETGIFNSVDQYVYLRSISNNGDSPDPVVPTLADFESYLEKDGVSWTAATSTDEKLKLIAEQKWLHFNVIQPNENWAELRRLDLVDLEFWTDQSNQQSQPPYRWVYPSSEITYNSTNYAAVQSEDVLTNKIFWAK